MTNDQPIHICIKVDKDILIANLIQQIIEFKDVNIDMVSKTSTLVLYSATKGSVRGIFNTSFKLTQYNLLVNEIEAIEVITKNGRDQIANFYNDNPMYCNSVNPDALLQVLVSNSPSEKLFVPKKASS